MTFPYIRPYSIHPSSPAGGTDNTPNAVNWSNIVWDGALMQGDIASQQITGISNSINLQIQPGTGSDPILYYQIGSSNLSGSHILNPPSSPWIAVTSNTTVTVNNNQWLSFLCHGVNIGIRTATIVNTSDSNQTLDTFTYEATFNF